MNRRTCTILLASACLLIVVGCGRGPGSSERRHRPQEKTLIGLCVCKSARSDPHAMLTTIKAEAAKRKLGVVMGESGQEFGALANAARRPVADRVDALVLGCCDAKTAQRSIDSATEAGVPVFAAETPCVETGGTVACSVRSDYRNGGRDAARAVVDMLNRQGDVALLDHPQSPAAVMVAAGFREQIALMPQMRIVATASGECEQGRARAAARAILEHHPDLGGLFAVDIPSALGAIQALADARKSGQVKIVAFGGGEAARRAVKQGALFAVVFPASVDVGRQAVDAVHTFLVGSSVPAKILVPCTVYRRADAAVDLTLVENAKEPAYSARARSRSLP